jgi:hypothetical protein
MPTNKEEDLVDKYASDGKDGEGVVEENRYKTPDYWRRWIKAVKKASQDHFDQAKEAWDEYELFENRPYPIYWSSVKTLEPAYYSRTPKILTEREFGIHDPVALTASLIAERVGKHLIGESDFDAVMQKVVLDFIHADKATAQVTYTADFKEEEARVEIAQLEDGSFINAKTQEVFDGDVSQDDLGLFANEMQKVPYNQRVRAVECSYDEILHSPEAKSESEIKEKAYYFLMDRQEAERRFGKDVASKINWKTKREAMSKEVGTEASRDLTEIVGEYIEGWECWYLPDAWVCWVSDQYQDGFLDQKDDPYGLKGFFPSPPFIISSRPSKTMYPTSAFQHLKACADQLHDAAERVTQLSAGAKRRALVDGADEDLIAALNSSEEGEYVAMTNLAKIVEKGGIENSVLWVPIGELVKAITELSNLQDKFKNEFFEWFGVPDILRGATDPLETASAQEIKSSAAHDRFKFQKKQIATLARDLIEMMTDLALAVYNEDLLKQIAGFDFMTPEHQGRWDAALQMLRDPKVRVVRLAIDTDTMSFVDEQQRAYKTQQAAQVLTNGLDKVYKMLEMSPDYAAVGLQALLLSLNAISPGKEFEDSVKKSVNALIEKAQAPKPEQPPPPDYEMLKIQVEQQRLQLDAQTKMRDLDRKDFQVQLKAQETDAKLQIASMEAQVKAQSEQFGQVLQRFMAELDAQRVAVEQFKAEIQAKESMMEEVRLASEVDAKMMEASQPKTEKEGGGEKGGAPGVVNVIQLPSTPEMPILGL